MGRPVALDLKGAPFGYVCGVTGRGYPTNLHVAFRPGKDAVIEEVLPHWQRLTIVGAERLPIPPLPEGWRGLDQSFTTCRNFRFGAHYFADSGGLRSQTQD